MFFVILFMKENASTVSCESCYTWNYDLKLLKICTVKLLICKLTVFFPFLLSEMSSAQVQTFMGNATAPDHFKILLTEGDSMIVGAR